jgi:chromosome partitioning protein
MLWLVHGVCAGNIEQERASPPPLEAFSIAVQGLNARRVIAVASGKGGTGKSTLALALGHALWTDCGIPVTLLDLDPQAGLTDYAGLSPTDDPLRDEPAIKHAMAIFRSGRALAHASDEEMAAHIQRATEGPGLVVVDLPPALSDVGHRVLFGRPDVQLLCAVRADIGGMRATGEVTALAQARGVPYRLVPTFGSRLAIALAAQSWMMTEYGDRVLEPIPEDAWAMHAPAHRKPVTLSAPKANVSRAIRSLAEMIAEDLQAGVTE